MERSFRYRSAGLIFYILFALLICSSEVVSGKIDDSLSPIFTKNDNGEQSTISTFKVNSEHFPNFFVTVEEIQSNDEKGNSFDSSSLLITLIGIGITIFTSDAMGYLLSSIFISIFNLFGGYSGLYKRKLKNDKYIDLLVDELNNELIKSRNNNQLPNFITTLDSFKHDPLLMFFLHHTKDLPDNLDKWIERRHTAFIAGWTNVVSIILAGISSIFAFIHWQLIPTCPTWIISGLSIIMIIIIIYNGNEAEAEALQVLDLRIAAKLNQNIQNMYKKYNNSLDANSIDNSSEVKTFLELTFQKIIKLFSKSSRKK